MELVKLVKDVPKDIIDGTGACPVAPADGTGVCPACPVASENGTRVVPADSAGVAPADGPGWFKKQKRNAQIQPRFPLFRFHLEIVSK